MSWMRSVLRRITQCPVQDIPEVKEVQKYRGNYPLCLPCTDKMHWKVTAGSIPVTTAGEILNK